MTQCQGLEKEVALSLMPGPSKGHGVSGGSACSVYCSHGTAKVTPAQLPWSLENFLMAVFLPSLRWRSRQDILPCISLFLAVLKELSLPAHGPVLMLCAELSAGIDDSLRIWGHKSCLALPLI